MACPEVVSAYPDVYTIRCCLLLASPWLPTLLLRSCSFHLSFFSYFCLIPVLLVPCQALLPRCFTLDLSTRRLPSPYSCPPTLILTHPSPHLDAQLISTTTTTQQTGATRSGLTVLPRNDRSLSTSLVTVVLLSQEEGWLISSQRRQGTIYLPLCLPV
ncbi:hypothetical protein CABS01_01147 [Colletotrichum abscissum]|uniref:uncharacterized protein n=1 Tax=Colletotrichum abscissum TaxID=1671311 RepID=UPI0027D48F0F|nr:uncharacterized protein CABS01_01147 [Colletotrichum abscissum]KAK1505679.1 hypothetical protein CABS01_01147 [Colletotrichum abscissum]